jgi:glycosyltransferase involved in cell wall biosynthesis
LNENLPSISIVIPTYNGEQTLAQCLESIVKQDYPREKVEIIIVDGGSKDKTLDVAKNGLDPSTMRTLENKHLLKGVSYDA